jgi:signal transduction histidine kinase/ligand-binding sensor domain-containing protein/DNA-binding response OmpR family regulator
MKLSRTILLCQIFLVLFVPAFSQKQKAISEEFVIDFINVRDGLTSNYISKTISDASNLKYFATEAGVSRYDGYSFKSFKPGESYPELLNENIETLFKDAENNIWIGTKSGGLSRLDVSRDNITQYNEIFDLKTEEQLHVMSINQDVRGYMWVGTWNDGVYVIDPVSKKQIHHFQSTTPILNIIRDKQNDIWFLAGPELLHYKLQESKLTRSRLPYFMNNLIEDTHRGKIWMVGNVGETVYLLSMTLSDQVVQIEPITLTARFIRSMAIDSKKRLWLGSWGDGLFISDLNVSSFQKTQTTPSGTDMESINHNSILDIEIDKNEIAWLSTANGGVLILYPNKGFTLISNNSVEVSNDQNAISVYRRADGKIYMGTISGLLVSDEEGQFRQSASIPRTRINSMEEKGAYLFIGSSKGLYVYNTQANGGKPMVKFPNEKITTTFLDRSNNLWIGTQQNGLRVTNIIEDPLLENTKIYSENGKGRYYLQNNRINKIQEDEAGAIWIATYGGLNRFDASTQNFVPHHNLIDKKLPTVIVNDFFIKKETMFLATPVGFIELTYQKDKLLLKEVYDKRNGLINDFICAVKEDGSGNLWMSSATSITRFDPFKKTFVNYDRQDGVMINSFHIGSCFADREGLIYFGGSNGIIRFHPDSLSENIKPPQVVLTGIIVNNKAISVGERVEDRILLDQDINYTEHLDLGYKQNHLTLIFVANDFFGTNNISYQYRLSGFQNDWINIRGRNELSFTGLSPGEYDLEIRASRDRQNWGALRSLRIEVDAPPWATWYAYLFYAVFTIGVGFLINYVSTRQARLETKLRIAEIEKEKEHDLNEAKIAFFTNISHEFRTPLTLILSPITEILSSQKIEASIREKLMLIENNAKRLLNLINQLLDFRKSEHGLLQLNVEHSDFVFFAHEVFLSFKDIARTKNIEYKFDSEIDRVLLLFDRDKMEIVLCNIISNAFKYSREGGQILVHLYIRDNYFNVDVKDNGIGMSADDAGKVFDRFYQVQSAQTAKMVGSGIGLAFTKNIVDLHHGNIFVKSIPGQETCFTTQLLLDNPFLKAQETSRKEINSDDYSNNLDPSWLNQNSLEIDTTAKKETVLVVDDNEDIRRYLRSLLNDEYKVIEADNGITGLAIAKTELPDIIVSDIMMPEMDGITFCQEIKSQIITSHIPIILLTARTSVVYEVSGLETGADDYVTKPFNPVIMKTRIHNILENRKKLRGYYLNRVRFEPDKQEIADGNSMDDAFIEKAIKLVNDNLTKESFGVDTLVNELCMSQSTLYRKLKSLTGLSITGFIRSVRLKRAAQMILNEDIKLSQIAFEVGFNDYKHFRVSFQEQFGCLPSDYKEEMVESLKKREGDCQSL